MSWVGWCWIGWGWGGCGDEMGCYSVVWGGVHCARTSLSVIESVIQTLQRKKLNIYQLRCWYLLL